ncbi:MAG: hypothetical protein MK033_03915 [Candidatus Caenarcaniphilales bacterium]|nr:hypothetical protein [Candidatus Caenarcaniphilales bacterium]
MNSVNPAVILAGIRTKIDAQQQVVGMLEQQLQNAILGGNTKGKDTLVNDPVAGSNSINDIYEQAFGGTDPGAKTELLAAINENLDRVGHVDPGEPVEQDALRQMLYQARALLGELRIEEQAWSEEVNSEKTLRKAVNDFAKV